MTGDLSSAKSVTYAQLLAANIRGARARAGLTQAIACDRMVALGHTAWRHYQTLSKAERGLRELAADELLALALSLETSISALTAAVDGDKPVTLTGDILIAPEAVRGLAYGATARPILWDGGKLDRRGGL